MSHDNVKANDTSEASLITIYSKELGQILFFSFVDFFDSFDVIWYC